MILYYNARYRCKPHHPKAKFCTRCLAIGHRADICPQVDTIRCKKCGTKLQTEYQGHPCKTACVNCEGHHSADDPTCPIRREADREATKAKLAEVVTTMQTTLDAWQANLSRLENSTSQIDGPSKHISKRMHPYKTANSAISIEDDQLTTQRLSRNQE